MKLHSAAVFLTFGVQNLLFKEMNLKCLPILELLLLFHLHVQEEFYRERKKFGLPMLSQCVVQNICFARSN